jgi:hypothetical protein
MAPSIAWIAFANLLGLAALANRGA